ncbi:uncharacterized protein EAF01_007073 [Botrytis porri]|uniref:BTB domain-containing protein n=1 Tax=Botrytis porri TaxID=87229 RepID=A0A4Z1KXX0_9HELO|nr:uncharacterized protein EAF01_007073 [Botrytis porri]KAF7901774.1 hypothetical protein EAF01_007073 [Botrytis porri]TGO89306.1 hypothetical protein BPOR_0115g00110 [Botrytis porri]
MSVSTISDSRKKNRPVSAAGSPVTLQVGERRFVTTKNTMTGESPFFAALLSGRWDSNEQVDGSYFIDADPNLFEHILRYLRRSVLPIFYDIKKGHDHALYLALLGEARYFQIARLENWLQNKRYLYAVRIYSSVEELNDLWSESLSTEEIVEYRPRWDTKQVYICPRGLGVHRGNSNACGRQCERARGDSEYIYENEPVLKTLVIRKKLVVDQAACMEGLDEE